VFSLKEIDLGGEAGVVVRVEYWKDKLIVGYLVGCR
jgi:hypothetical protein